MGQDLCPRVECERGEHLGDLAQGLVAVEAPHLCLRLGHAGELGGRDALATVKLDFRGLRGQVC
jgi:hypothetical protein